MSINAIDDELYAQISTLIRRELLTKVLPQLRSEMLAKNTPNQFAFGVTMEDVDAATWDEPVEFDLKIVVPNKQETPPTFNQVMYKRGVELDDAKGLHIWDSSIDKDTAVFCFMNCGLWIPISSNCNAFGEGQFS